MAGRAATGPAVVRTGAMLDAEGRKITFRTDCDAVVISTTGQVVLDAAGRKEFQLRYMEAERQAEVWAAEHTQTGAAQ